jgi:magnesium chelatase family protein
VLATVSSATVVGVKGQPVRVEVHVGAGLPSFTVVGQPDSSCREARDRVRAAFAVTGLAWPNKKVTVNLAPSGVRKVGTGLDLAVAVGVLVAADELPAEAIAGLAFVGELGLDGTLRPVPGTVPIVGALAGARPATGDGPPWVVVPVASHVEAGLVVGERVRPVAGLRTLVDVLRGEQAWPDPPVPGPVPAPPHPPDLADVRGQPVARLGLELAAAGGHHLLLVGPPGAGKTMLARRLPGLLPPLGADDALEATCVHSAAGVALPPGGLVRVPPFRAPHHATSAAALIGGGSVAIRPGEASLAAHGVLFLDELGEFPPAVLDALRTPLEEGVVRVARARESVELPARFLLVAAMNPCPCGDGGPPGACRCSPAARARYHRRLSGPLLDRLDLRVEVGKPTADELLGHERGEPTAPVAERVAAARERAAARGVAANAELSAAAIEVHCRPSIAAGHVLEGALRTGQLSARGLARVRAVARTIADLRGGGGDLAPDDVALALSLRRPVVTVDHRLAG